jgi:hypothetical protein
MPVRSARRVCACAWQTSRAKFLPARQAREPSRRVLRPRTRRLTTVGAAVPGTVKSHMYVVCDFQEVLGGFGYIIENVVAATKDEAAMFKLPSGCVQLLG